MVTGYKAYWRLAVVVLLVFLTLFVWYVAATLHPGKLRFVMLDIGQGDALYIEAPDGNQVIIDGGPGDALLGQLGKVMSPWDRSIDLIMNTNPDVDHFTGFIPLLDRYSVGAFMEAGTNASSSELWQTLEKKIDDKKIPRLFARRGQVIDLGGGVTITILFPDRDVSGMTHNDGSIVARLDYGKTSIMLTGDSTQKIEKYLISLDTQNETDDLSATILKVGHHGSDTSTSVEFVAAVHPVYAAISSGHDNMYGHPDQVTLDTLNKAGVEIIDTCVNGPIEFDSDGTTFTLKNEKINTVSAGCK